ncbi:MAG: diaminopimelate decarboxylase [Kiritimatiellaeota bacterium]|nr:diaminopimelate decarboxylase [Kiritimatiellota bacterium]
MPEKKLPFTCEQLERMANTYPTPFHVYDERGIRENARRLNAAFAWNPGFKEYFAVKACPNPYLMKILREEGFGMDCSSLPELLLAERVGVTGEGIMFTSNDTPEEEFIKAKALGAVINLDDLTHIPFLEKCTGLPALVCFRYNPGPLKGGNAIIGHPEQAKYGFTREQLFEGYRMLKQKGVTRFGLHTMVASNELNPQYFIDTAELLFGLAVEVSQELGITFEFVNIGGGIGIPYTPEQAAVDVERVSEGVRKAYETRVLAGHPPLKLYMECGRMVTGPYGYLVSRVRHIKKTYKAYAGLDACMTNLMRPALYGAYHHITVPAKAGQPCGTLYDVTGSLCENNDKFAIDRPLPELASGDLVVIHDTGAHGHAMGFQYNGKLRSAELLLREDGTVVPIRRAETVEDYFATLDFSALPTFT